MLTREQWVAFNARGLAVLGMAGVTPTNTVEVPFANFSPAQIVRLTEPPITGYPIPGPRIPITPSRTDLKMLYVAQAPH